MRAAGSQMPHYKHGMRPLRIAMVAPPYFGVPPPQSWQVSPAALHVVDRDSDLRRVQQGLVVERGELAGRDVKQGRGIGTARYGPSVGIGDGEPVDRDAVGERCGIGRGALREGLREALTDEADQKQDCGAY